MPVLAAESGWIPAWETLACCSLRECLQLLARHHREKRDVQEAHAVHLEGRGAAHARQPLPSVHEKNIVMLPSAAVTTWCYSLLVLLSPPVVLLTATNPRIISYVPHCPL